MQHRIMRVLAIDPGYERMGVAVVETASPKEVVLYSDCFQTKVETPFPDRLVQIGHHIESILHKYSPDALALEQLFFNTNQKTAMRVSEVRGVMIYLGRANNKAVFEYTPLQVKIAILGYGRGEKRQITDMVEKLVSVSKKIRFDDEYDAIAIGLTCLAHQKNFLYRQEKQKNMP